MGLFDQPPKHKLICSPSERDSMLPGSVPEFCSKCRKGVWLSSAGQQMVKDFDCLLVCEDCEDLADVPAIYYDPRVLRELNANIGPALAEDAVRGKQREHKRARSKWN